MRVLRDNTKMSDKNKSYSTLIFQNCSNTGSWPTNYTELIDVVFTRLNSYCMIHSREKCCFCLFLKSIHSGNKKKVEKFRQFMKLRISRVRIH